MLKTAIFRLTIVLLLVVSVMPVFKTDAASYKYNGPGFVIDQNSDNITQIPQYWIEKAKTDLHIGYGHWSHGAQLTSGMHYLVDFANGGGLGLSLPPDFFAWGNGDTGGVRLDLEDTYNSGGDLNGYIGLTNQDGSPKFYSDTIDYLNASGRGDVNVIMWAWSGGIETIQAAGNIKTFYLDKMEALEALYPKINFIYMTSRSNKETPEQYYNTKAANDIIRQYCLDNRKILYDFYELDSHDPDGTYFEFSNDSNDYYDSGDNLTIKGNWAREWETNPLHPQGPPGGVWYNVDPYPTPAVSTIHTDYSVGCNLKAYAAWWLFARLAGWDGTPNRAPSSTAKSVGTSQNTSLAITLTATDDDLDPLTYHIVNPPSHGTLSVGNAPDIIYTPALGYTGSDSFTFKTNDGHLDSNTATVSITVNDVNRAPVSNAQSVSTNKNIALAITLTATDADNDSLTYSIVTQPPHGSISGAAPNVTYTPNLNYNGSDSFTFKANDGKVDSNTATISITVAATTPNPPPSEGGGGGGGPSGVTSLAEYITSNGTFVANATAESGDGIVKLDLPKGTVGKNSNGQRLYSISIKENTAPPAPPADCNFVCLTYDIGPAGAIFAPPIYLTFKYDDSQVPAGVSEENLKLATWLDGKWVPFEDCTIDPINNTITIPLSHFSTFNVLAYTSPASFEVSGLTISPTEVHPGETVTVSATITNTGDLTGSFEAILKINNLELQTEKVTLDGGQSRAVSFTVIQDTTGEYTVEINGLSSNYKVKEPVPEGTVAEVTLPPPASFTISGLSITPDEVNPDEEVTISTVVTNIGGSQGSYILILKINTQEEAKKEVELEADQSQKVSFTTVASVGGNNSIDINGKAGQFNVIVPPPTSPKATDEIPYVRPTNWPLYIGVTAAFGGMVIIGLSTFIMLRRRRSYRTWQ